MNTPNSAYLKIHNEIDETLKETYQKLDDLDKTASRMKLSISSTPSNITRQFTGISNTVSKLKWFNIAVMVVLVLVNSVLAVSVYQLNTALGMHTHLSDTKVEMLASQVKCLTTQDKNAAHSECLKAK